jgi:hypothetical protein
MVRDGTDGRIRVGERNVLLCCAALRWCANPMVALIFRRGEVVPRCSHRPVDDGRRKRSICRAALPALALVRREKRAMQAESRAPGHRYCRPAAAAAGIVAGAHVHGTGCFTSRRLRGPAEADWQCHACWKRSSHSLVCFEAASLPLVRRHRGRPRRTAPESVRRRSRSRSWAAAGRGAGCTLNEQGAALAARKKGIGMQRYDDQREQGWSRRGGHQPEVDSSSVSRTDQNGCS